MLQAPEAAELPAPPEAAFPPAASPPAPPPPPAPLAAAAPATWCSEQYKSLQRSFSTELGKTVGVQVHKKYAPWFVAQVRAGKRREAGGRLLPQLPRAAAGRHSAGWCCFYRRSF
jgi:hypothetical protein